MTHTLSSPRDDRFVDYPEPSVEVPQFRPHFNVEGKPGAEGDEFYWVGLERLIKFLGTYVRSIQREEAVVLSDFAKNKLLKPDEHIERNKEFDKRDRLTRAEFADSIGTFQKRRRAFKQIIKDAVDEKHKYLDSLIFQREMQDWTRRLLARLNFVDTTRTRDKQKIAFDFYVLLAFFFQLVLTLLYIVITDYNLYDVTANNGGPYRADDYFSYFIHIGLMVAFGFGYLLVWIKTYGFSASVLNVVLVAFAAEFSIIVQALFFNFQVNPNSTWEKMNLTIPILIEAFYAAATVSISFGLVAGKAGPGELMGLSLLEVFFYHVNRWITRDRLYLVDPGGAMNIHVFGAFFGLGVTYWLSKPFDPYQLQVRRIQETMSTYTSQFISLIGSIFVFCLFPSFNAALAPDGTQYRATVNTFISLIGSAVAAFIASKAVVNRRFHISDIQAGIIAGGVAMASGHSILISPGAALVVGTIAGGLSVVSLNLIQPFVEKKLPFHLYDTRGVLSVHGLPGLMAGLASAIALSVSAGAVFGQPTRNVLPAGLPNQGGYQGAGLFISLAISILSGFFAGFVMWIYRGGRKKGLLTPFRDEYIFHTPSDYAKDANSGIIAEL